MSKTKSTLIDEAYDALSELRDKQQGIVKNVIDSIKPIIKESKFFSQINWTQYTPYFNDGDVCEFSVHELNVRLTKEGCDFLNKHQLKPSWAARNNKEWVWGSEDEHEISKIQDALNSKIEVVDFEDMTVLGEAIEEIANLGHFLQTNEAELKAAFGDHTMVTINKEGIETEEYEHD